MTEPIRRYKTLHELTAREHEIRKYQDPTVRFETPEYREAREKALQRAGLADTPDRTTED